MAFAYHVIIRKNGGAKLGRILFISSESGVQIPAEMIHYGVSKTAQIAVANGLAQLTKGTNVTVNSVLPGPTMSEGAGYFLAALAKEANKSPSEVEADFSKRNDRIICFSALLIHRK